MHLESKCAYLFFGLVYVWDRLNEIVCQLLQPALSLYRTQCVQRVAATRVRSHGNEEYRCDVDDDDDDANIIAIYSLNI